MDELLDQPTQKKIEPLKAEELTLPLWDSELCARYLRVTYRQFAERTSYDVTFPAGTRIGSGAKAPRRWPSVKVRQWAGELEIAA